MPGTAQSFPGRIHYLSGREIKVYPKQGTGDAGRCAMSYFDNPGRLEVAMEEIVYRFGGSLYRNYLRTLGLEGNERVLEFGSGGGGCSRQLLYMLAGEGTLTCVDTSKYWMERAKKRLRGNDNVTFLQGDIRRLAVAEGSFDCVIVHLVLHDIKQKERQGTVDALAAALRQGGTLFIREPTGEHHGMPAAEIRALMNNAGLSETAYSHGKSLLIGPFYAGTYVKE